MRLPTRIPSAEMPAVIKRKGQSIGSCPISPVKPNKDLTVIIISDVATASFIGILARITSAGMMRKPPPAPTKPVTAPTMRPSRVMRGKFKGWFSSLSPSLRPLIIETEAANMITAKTVMMSWSLLMLTKPRLISAGISGMRNFLTKKTPKKAGTAKIAPILKFTRPCLVY